jgi:hypothetical protein
MTRNAATGKWMTGFARVGYAAKGVVYLIIGFLAAKLAIGQGGAATDQRGALHTIYNEPSGKFLLIVVALGLIAYGVYSFVEARYRRLGRAYLCRPPPTINGSRFSHRATPMPYAHVGCSSTTRLNILSRAQLAHT